MRIYFNRRPRPPPWGGGSKIVTALAESLQQDGHTISFEMKNIDVYMCFDPRPSDDLSGFWDILAHKNANGGRIVQRVGDVGTHGKPDLTALVKTSIKLSNHVIFTSSWAKNYVDPDHSINNHAANNYSIIHNAPLKVFHKYKMNASRASLAQSVRVITHHWSDNTLKGHAALECFDDAISKGLINAKFTYVGRGPSSFKLKSTNSRHLSPMTAEELAVELPKHDLYLTASKFEAGANHVLEAMAAGLPVMYHADGGSIPEYCSGYGIKFDGDTTADKLVNVFNQSIIQFDTLKSAVMQYNETIDDIVEQYKKIIYAK